MINLTMDQIRAAQAGDAAATEDVVREIEPRIAQLARRYATNQSGTRDWGAIEDFEQMGHLSLLESLGRFKGSTVAEFFKFVDTTVAYELTGERRRNQRPGVGKDTSWAFEKAIKAAGGDPYLAEKLSQSRDLLGKRRLSSAMAYAARISWQGFEYIEGSDEDGEDVSLFDIKADEAGLSYEINYDAIEGSVAEHRPITWVGPTNALSRLAKVSADAEKRETLLTILDRIATGYVREADVEWLADNVTVGTDDPRDVVDAVAMLRSLVGLCDAEPDEPTAREISKARAAETVGRVRGVLAEMSKRGKGGADILRGTFGLSPAPYAFGTENEDELAEWVGQARKQVRGNRVKAKARFAALWEQAS